MKRTQNMIGIVAMPLLHWYGVDHRVDLTLVSVCTQAGGLSESLEIPYLLGHFSGFENWNDSGGNI